MPRCEICQKGFESQEGLDQHNADKHTQATSSHDIKKTKKLQKLGQKAEEKGRLNRSKRMRNMAMIGGVSLVLAAVVYAALFVFPQQNPQGNQLPVGTDAVLTNGVPDYPIHWHPHLRIVIKGEEQVIPANIGLTSANHEPIHTHEADGIIHVENTNPTQENMKLAYFFGIWGKTFNKDCIFDHCNGPDGTVKFFINGEQSNLFENYVYRDKDELLIEYS